MNTRADRDALARASTQHWTLTRAEALEAGMSSDMIRHRLQQKLWSPIREGTYLVVPTQPTPGMFLEAALHSIRGAVVSHEAAGEIHELAYVPTGLATISVPVSTTHSFPSVVIHRVKDLQPLHVLDIKSLAVTSVLRSLVDLSAVLSPARFERVLDDALATQRVGLEEFRMFSDALAGRGKPGSALRHRLLGERGAGFVAPHSHLERILFRVMRWGGLPEPERQVPLPGWEVVQGVCDCAYVWARLIIEADGRRWHTREAEFERDRSRDNHAVRHAWRVLRFTYEMLKNNPAEVVATIRDALAAAHG